MENESHFKLKHTIIFKLQLILLCVIYNLNNFQFSFSSVIKELLQKIDKKFNSAMTI